MNFLWSSLLYLLLLIPLILAAYVWTLRRRRKYAVRYSSLSLVRDAMAHQSAWRRHLPFALFLLALTSLVFALARPTATVMVPSNKATIILALDVSRSMCSTDIPPNRLEAAKEAALAFVQKQERGRQIGLVAFAGFAELVQPPTADRALLESAIQNLTPARRTAIGSAILRSLDAISEVDPNVAPGDTGNLPEGAFTPVPEGQYAPHLIVLLTDGASNAGPNPLSAAVQAAERGIRVYTIGFGTTRNTSPMNCGYQIQENDIFGGGFGNLFGGGGGGFRREIDEETLKAIANMTDGTYQLATSAGELQNVFQNLPTNLVATRETIEIGAFFTAFAALLAVLALILSIRLYPLG
jgi:Ca-activated chloride channel family protein